METTQLNTEQEEFTQDVEQIEKLAAEQSALVPYLPKSNASFKMETLIPRNMAFEVQKSLNRIVKEKGNIDNYVRNELKYISTATLWKAFSAEQVDAVGLYLKQFERQQGIIIGDQTGIGKGRQAAAVIRHAVVQGYLPIFFTKSPNLFTDMYRDLKAIGQEDIHPFILNTGGEAKIKDEDGHVVFTPLSNKEQQELLTIKRTFPTESPESIEWHKRNSRTLPDPEETPTITIFEEIDYLPTGYDMIFSTYSQVQSAAYYKRAWIERICKSGIEKSKRYKKVVFILDESHCAGGFESIIGRWMRQVLPETVACCFLSATFAKYPEVMPFYGKKTAISETGLSDSNFVGSMRSGGLALQEIVASNLAESGQLIRRQRSSEGIKVEYIVLDKEPQRSKNRESVNRIIKLMNEVVRFEEEYVAPVLSDIHSAAKASGEGVKEKPRGLGVKQAPYFSRVFNIVDQMLFALKVQEVARKTIELLKADKKVVIAFKSTMGNFLKDLNLSSGDVIPKNELDFVRTLIKGLDSVFYYNYTDIAGAKSRERVPLNALSQKGQEEYHRIKKAMLLESSGLSVSPIDQLIQLIEQENKPKSIGGHDDDFFKVAEVTGRNQKVYFDEDNATVSSFRSDAERAFRLFNQGEYDVLLINQSGSTGASAHASKDFEDQRQRAMIIHQFELDINVEVQKRGRINRTGQVNLPEYYYMTSDIPTERRLMTMLKAKLKSLDANTTASQKTNDDTLKSADFLNKYGDKVAWQWINENPEMLSRLGHPTYHKKTDSKTGEKYYERNDFKEGAIRQLTGRAGLLLVEEQDRLYNELLERYDHQIILEKQQGTYDLEAEFLKLDADLKKRFLFQRGKGGITPFGKDTVREINIVNNLKRPLTKQQLDERITQTLEGKKPEQLRSEMVNAINEDYPKIIEARKEKRMEVINKLREELEALPEKESGSDQEANEKIENDRNKIQKLITEKHLALDRYLKELEQTKQQLLRSIQYFTVGQVLKIPHLNSLKEPSWGIFLGVSIGTAAKNPYTPGNMHLRFAVADSRKLLSYSLQPAEESFISIIRTRSEDITDEEKLEIPLQWNDFIKKASSKRERRHILTENIVAASFAIGAENKLIKYNTKSGVIKNGILMARGYGKDGEDKTLLPISEALGIIKALPLDETFAVQNDSLRFKRIGENYWQVYLSKKNHYELAINPKLRQLIRKAEGQSEDELPDFVQNAGDMTGVVHHKNLEGFLKQLDTYNIQFLGKAKALEDWEIENQKEWEKNTKTSKGSYTYELGRPYGQGSNPSIGFKAYTEPDGTTYQFGLVVYGRPLTDKEKYNYSLIPIYKNVEQPYQAWKKGIENTSIQSDFESKLKEVDGQLLYQAKQELGQFIMNNAHEDGNPEFVFGKYAPEELGQAAYEDMFGPIEPIDVVLDQLKLYHSLRTA